MMTTTGCNIDCISDNIGKCQVCLPVRSVCHPSLQTWRQGLPKVFIPRHKMETILLGVCVYGTLLKFYLLFQLFGNNDVKLATSIIGRNGAVNTAQLLASLFGASQCR